MGVQMLDLFCYPLSIIKHILAGLLAISSKKHIQVTPLNWDTLVPDILSRLSGVPN